MQKLNIPSRILNPGNPIYVGSSSYHKLRKGQYCIIDKSLLIKEFIEDGEEVVIVTRPRRFGKSMNMNMLKCFFEIPQKDDPDCKDAFEGTLISEDKEILNKYYQKYPVIHLTFKEIRDFSWEEAFYNICKLIKKEIKRHCELKDYNNFDDYQFNNKRIWDKIMNDTANESDWAESLKIFSQLLKLTYGKKPFILIDEWDTPINHAYLNTEKKDVEDNNSQFQKMLNFMRSLLSSALKDNENLHKGLLVGILRLSRENFLTGLNNSGVSDVTESEYMYHYGFTENEVMELLKYKHSYKELKEVKRWYNGYMFGTYENIYNPWSIRE